MSAGFRPRLWFPAVALVILISDQWTKQWIGQRLRFPGDQIPVIPGFFDLTRVHNDGMAFGFFQGNNGLLAVVVVGILVAGLWFSRLLDWRALETNCVGGLVVGGALGNLIDRLRFGYVLDFFDFNLWITRWPAFNIADAAISCSMVWIAGRMILEEWRSKGRG
jgi:signal peptidase II